ncbi:MAG: AraC family transcriptional regulator [Propionibacteriaceae bacterium]
MDLLSAVLRELRLDSASYRRLELGAPWRLRFDGGLRGVHVVVHGSCSLRVDGTDWVQLDEGDLVVLPRADSHSLGSAPHVRGPELSSLDAARRTEGPVIRLGGSGAQTTIVCGAFWFSDQTHPVIEGLPRLIHVPGRGGRSPSWLTGLTEALAQETLEYGPGSDVVMARLSDALVTRALRYYLEGAEEPGWLHGLRDPAIARALAAVHDDLAAPWTLVTWSRTAGLSRAGFAARFATVVGQTPMQYLFECRMRRAMTLLRTEQSTVASVASRVGYGSEAALSAAFVRHTGTSPGAYRRAAG